MDGFVPKKPGIQHDLFATQEIVITDRPNPALYIGKPPVREQAPVDQSPAPSYDRNLVSNIVRAYMKWGG